MEMMWELVLCLLSYTKVLSEGKQSMGFGVVFVMLHKNTKSAGAQIRF
jgi:hypothetical protein